MYLKVLELELGLRSHALPITHTTDTLQARVSQAVSYVIPQSTLKLEHRFKALQVNITQDKQLLFQAPIEYRILPNTRAGANTKISRGACVFGSNYI